LDFGLLVHVYEFHVLGISIVVARLSKGGTGLSWVQMKWLASLQFALTVITKALNGWINDRIGKSAPSFLPRFSWGDLYLFCRDRIHRHYC
jgi:hypothetical protein